jgi:hypothetical protein
MSSSSWLYSFYLLCRDTDKCFKSAQQSFATFIARLFELMAAGAGAD